MLSLSLPAVFSLLEMVENFSFLQCAASFMFPGQCMHYKPAGNGRKHYKFLQWCIKAYILGTFVTINWKLQHFAGIPKLPPTTSFLRKPVLQRMWPAVANGHMPNNGNITENGDGGNLDRPALRYWKNKLTVLLIDESENHRVLGTAYLTCYGAETASVNDGRAALELIFSGARFGLILIEMHMRYMSGAQCVNHLRNMGVRSMMIGMTTFSREREERAFLDAGGNGLIPKPLNPEKVLQVLEALDNRLG